jgi:hypothetical protein
MLYMLENTSSLQVKSLGQRLLYERPSYVDSFEAAAQLVTETIYKTFRTAERSHAFSLVRVFRIGLFDELPPDLTIQPTNNSRYWVTLAGTFGTQPEWCERRLSKGHRAIPEQAAQQAPMLHAAFSQIGLQWGAAAADEMPVENTELMMTRYFYIKEALNSPYIVDQEAFVKPHGIQSVIGFGGSFIGGAAFVTIAFSRVKLEKHMADTFVTLSPFIATLLALCNQKRLWD